MANPLKGEAVLVVDDKSHTLVFHINALVEAEALLGVPTAEIERRLGGGADLTVIRGMLWAGLQESSPNLTVTDAGVLVQRAGADKAVVAIRDALKAAFPAPPKPGAKPSPRKAARGTGSSSMAAG